MSREKVVITKVITIQRKKNGGTYKHYSNVGTPKKPNLKFSS